MTEDTAARCDIIMVTWNEPTMTRAAIESIHRNANHPYRLIVVDNASDRETVSLLREAEWTQKYGPMVAIYNDENLGWTKALNQGLAVSRAPYVCIMNNDVITGRNWLRNMIRTMELYPEIGLANPQERRLIRGNTFDDVNRHADRLAREHEGKFIEIDYGSGFCLLIRRAVIDAVGGFDEQYGAGYYEDEDFSRRAVQAGYLCVRCLDALVLHFISRSFGKDPERKSLLSERNRAIYEARWGRHRHLLVLPRYPATEDLLRLARQRHILYVVENRYVNRRTLPHPHANIKWRGRGLAWISESLYFRLKAWQLRRQGRIDDAVILEAGLKI